MIASTDYTCPLPGASQAQECQAAVGELPDEARELFGALYAAGMIEGGRAVTHIAVAGQRLYWDGETYDPHDLRGAWRESILAKAYDLTRKLTKLNVGRLAKKIQTQHGEAFACKHCKTIVLAANLPHTHRCIFLSADEPGEVMDSAIEYQQRGRK